MKVTLKDLFAMHAMHGILERGDGDPIEPRALAQEAWEIAFAMWAERQRIGRIALDSSLSDSVIVVEVQEYEDKLR